MLGDFPTNQKSIAVQIMRRFQNEQELSNSTPPTEYSADLQDSLHTFHSSKAHISVLMESEQQNPLLLHTPLLTPQTHKWPDDSTEFCDFPSHKTIGVIGNCRSLISTYSSMFSNYVFETQHMPKSVTFYSYCKVAGMRLGIKDNHRTKKLSHILFAPLCSTDPERELIPAQIQRIFIHRIDCGKGKRLSHTFAQVQCYCEHQDRYRFGNSLQLWSRTQEITLIIPIIRVYSRFAPAFGTIKRSDGTYESVMFVCPLARHLAL